jgi:uncharacterized repeat protein (TIGR03806 family)
MNKIICFTALLSMSILVSCSKNDSEDSDYSPITTIPVSVDLNNVPYQKLSSYNFFQGDLKNLSPNSRVLPYEPSSTLFSDYAHKKRFVWIPENKKATYNGDNKVLELPVGSVLIKNFYYENTQPSNTKKIIETRVMIRKESGWIFANYVWNDAQTEATFDLGGSTKNITWIDNNITKTVSYRIPNESQCIVCHKNNTIVGGQPTTIHTPIGIKPQSLNFEYNYGNSTKNQLLKWQEVGYLTNNFNLPSIANTVVNYNDATKPLENRVRAYFDINCAHCHNENGHCNYRPMKFDFNSTQGSSALTNMGVCVDTQDMQGFPSELSKIIAPRRPDRSMLFYRINTTDESYMMPLHGRSLIHTEGVQLIEQWINSLDLCN